MTLPSGKGVLTPSFPFHLEYTLKCGQIFGWRKINGGFAGSIENEPVYIEETDASTLLFIGSDSACEKAKQFFRFDDRLEEITASWQSDPILSEASRRFRGLRLLKQDPWQCTAGFILSIVSNIPKIETTLSKLVHHHKNRFPTPEEIARIPESTLRKFGMGFRARYLKATARKIADGFPLQTLAERPYPEAKQALMELPGIGEKVADCILLFGLGHLEAFPVDVWMKRIVETLYFKKRTKTEKYISEWGRNRFGRNAGYAQQYLYTYGRLLLDRQSLFRLKE